MTLTDADLARLEALDKAATQPPWEMYRYPTGGGRIHISGDDGRRRELIADMDRELDEVATVYNENDRELLFELGNRRGEVLAELREARAALARVKALCEQAEHGEGIVITPGFVTYYSVECGLLRAAMTEPVAAACEVCANPGNPNRIGNMCDQCQAGFTAWKAAKDGVSP